MALRVDMSNFLPKDNAEDKTEKSEAEEKMEVEVAIVTEPPTPTTNTSTTEPANLEEKDNNIIRRKCRNKWWYASDRQSGS